MSVHKLLEIGRLVFASCAIAACSSEGGSAGSTTSASSSTTVSPTTGSSSGQESSETTGAAAPRVRLVTDLGDMLFEIYEIEAPITAGNFLRYVDEDRFEGATFYRAVTLDNQPNDTVKIEVIQGGLAAGGPNVLPPIEHETTDETGILHLDGTISMARAEVGTASSELFVCIGDQPELDFGGERNPDGQGFAAFGRMLEGQAIAVMIQQQPEVDQYLTDPIPITSVARD